jgi:ribosome-associated protein
MIPDIYQRPFYQEFQFTASRSSGAGGQNVNKVSSRIELRFHVSSSASLSEEEKKMVLEKAGNKISKEGFLQIFSQTSRSQLVNKQTAVKSFYTLLVHCFTKKKVRRPTGISKSARQKRLNSKKINSEKKSFRNFKAEE